MSDQHDIVILFSTLVIGALVGAAIWCGSLWSARQVRIAAERKRERQVQESERRRREQEEMEREKQLAVERLQKAERVTRYKQQAILDREAQERAVLEREKRIKELQERVERFGKHEYGEGHALGGTGAEAEREVGDVRAVQQLHYRIASSAVERERDERQWREKEEARKRRERLRLEREEIERLKREGTLNARLNQVLKQEELSLQLMSEQEREEEERRQRREEAKRRREQDRIAVERAQLEARERQQRLLEEEAARKLERDEAERREREERRRVAALKKHAELMEAKQAVESEYQARQRAALQNTYSEALLVEEQNAAFARTASLDAAKRALRDEERRRRTLRDSFDADHESSRIASDANGVLLAVRLPSGARVQRRFDSSASVAVVRSFIEAHLVDEEWTLHYRVLSLDSATESLATVLNASTISADSLPSCTLDDTPLRSHVADNVRRILLVVESVESEED